VLALGGGVKSGASLEGLLAQDDATSARTIAAAARSPGLDTLCSYRQERAPPARSSGLVLIRYWSRWVHIISAFVENRRAEGAEAGRVGLPPDSPESVSGCGRQGAGRGRPASRVLVSGHVHHYSLHLILNQRDRCVIPPGFVVFLGFQDKAGQLLEQRVILRLPLSGGHDRNSEDTCFVRQPPRALPLITQFISIITATSEEQKDGLVYCVAVHMERSPSSGH
jgi:hypothetical protein